MSISSALAAGVSGLNANAARLAGISDNIANSGTYGYRRVETDFESIVLGDARGAGRYTAGGVASSSRRVVDEKGNLVGTENPLDIAISGNGMLPVINSSQLDSLGNGDVPLLMTRTGSFRTDEEGVLKTSSGLVLMGWAANRDGTIPNQTRDSAAGLTPIVLNSDDVYAEPTTRIGVGFNLPAEATVGVEPRRPRSAISAITTIWGLAFAEHVLHADGRRGRQRSFEQLDDGNPRFGDHRRSGHRRR